MEQLGNYLRSLRGDIFKLLPMKESEMSGMNNHMTEYLESLIINITGAMTTYPILVSEKQYLYVVNNIHYLRDQPIDFGQWRKIILNSTRNIDNLCAQYGDGMYGK